jgi:formate hydrogenlyase transcriptional activator
MPDPERNHRTLVRFFGALQSCQDLRSLFQVAAGAIRELTSCASVRLLLTASDPPRPLGFVTDFHDARDCSEIAAQSRQAPEVRWVIEHRQPCLARRSLFVPLTCRGEVTGVLEICAPEKVQPQGWDTPFLEEMAQLLGLAVDALVAHARLAELQRFQRESAYLRGEIKGERDLRPLTGESPAMKAVRLAIQQVAATDCTVLILIRPSPGHGSVLYNSTRNESPP